MSESADDLSKSEEISLNLSLNKCYPEEDSPNFADTYNAWRKYVFVEITFLLPWKYKDWLNNTRLQICLFVFF